MSVRYVIQVLSPEEEVRREAEAAWASGRTFDVNKLSTVLRLDWRAG